MFLLFLRYTLVYTVIMGSMFWALGTGLGPLMLEKLSYLAAPGSTSTSLHGESGSFGTLMNLWGMPSLGFQTVNSARWHVNAEGAAYQVLQRLRFGASGLSTGNERGPQRPGQSKENLFCSKGLLPTPPQQDLHVRPLLCFHAAEFQEIREGGAARTGHDLSPSRKSGMATTAAAGQSLQVFCVAMAERIFRGGAYLATHSPDKTRSWTSLAFSNSQEASCNPSAVQPCR